MPVLDASFLIDVHEGEPSAVRALSKVAQSDLRIPAQSVKEFLAGYDEPIAALRVLRTNYALYVEDDEQWLVAARLRRVAAKTRRRAGWGDVSIAAAAIVQATYVITADISDFRALGCAAWDYRHEPDPPA